MGAFRNGLTGLAILLGSSSLVAGEDAKPAAPSVSPPPAAPAPLAPGRVPFYVYHKHLITSKDALPVPQPGPRLEAIGNMLSSIKLPPGFHISLYALVPAARHMAAAASGRVVFVGTRMSKVYAVSGPQPVATASAAALNTTAVAGATPPGIAGPVVKEFAGTIAKVVPNGVCLAKDGTLYVVEQNRVLSFKNAELYLLGEEVSVDQVLAQGELIPRQQQSFSHTARVCRVGPDEKLYISLGEPANVPTPAKLAEHDQWGIGGIVRVDRTGKNREVFALGVRNSVGMAFNPADGTLWFTDNQVDGLGDDQPPGELNRATRAGQNFGFPWYGGGHTRTKEYKDQTPPADVVFPMVEQAAHAADLGLTFYSGSAFPQKYRGGIFSAQHGSWNRTKPIGARIMFTPVTPDGTADHSEVFAEGWLTPAGKYLGRPVDVAELPDGSLMVSDDELGALYRITYDGK